MKPFRKRDFVSPPARFFPGYFWFINDKIDEKRMLAQLRDMAAHAAKTVCLHPLPPEFRPKTFATRLDRPYLSDAYFRMIRKMVAACRRLGMEYWLYDEGGWPSGGACGQVLAKNPQGFARMSVQDSPSGPVGRSLGGASS